MKKSNFLTGKKVVITSPENEKETIIVKIEGSVIKKANTEFVYFNKEGKLCTFTFGAIQEMYKATPLTEKVFSSIKSKYAKRPKFSMPTVKWPKVSIKYA